MSDVKRAVLVVAHGSPARDLPEALKRERRKLKAKDGKSREELEFEVELEDQIRRWPRNLDNDPYARGTEQLVAQLAALLGDVPVLAAYNEFATPNVEEAVGQLADQGVERIDVLSTMVTPGGGHSEKDIPEALARCRRRFPKLELVYRWPYDLAKVATILAAQLEVGPVIDE
jgi:sirohydrochlorin cobaltochelatase